MAVALCGGALMCAYIEQIAGAEQVPGGREGLIHSLIGCVAGPYITKAPLLTRVPPQADARRARIPANLPQRRTGGPGPYPAGRPGPFRFPEPLPLLIEGLALRKPAASAAHVHRQVTEVAEREGWPVPSYATVYAIIRDVDPAL